MVKASIASSPISLDQVLILIAEDGEREVFCAPLQIFQSEFYKAGAAGLKPEVKAAIDGEEYQGEETMIFEGQKYAIMKTYARADGLVELTGVKKAGLR